MVTAAALHLEYMDAVTRADFALARSLLHESEYVYMSSDGSVRVGPDAGIAVAEMYVSAFPDISFEILHQFSPSDDISILEFIARGTQTAPLESIPATGRTVELRICNVIEARDDKVIREREYFDNLSILQQLGVIET